jgi:hypothetical protein
MTINFNEWREKSLKGEVCAVFGCRNTPSSQCPTCHFHWCYEDIMNHKHIMSNEELSNQEREDESLR